MCIITLGHFDDWFYCNRRLNLSKFYKIFFWTGLHSFKAGGGQWTFVALAELLRHVQHRQVLDQSARTDPWKGPTVSPARAPETGDKLPRLVVRKLIALWVKRVSFLFLLAVKIVLQVSSADVSKFAQTGKLKNPFLSKFWQRKC